MKVAVILPSRGLIFSQTAEEILNNVKDIPHKFFFSHRKPIPECFEVPTIEALGDSAVTHLWFVEDDMIIPPDTLKQMLDADKAVVTANYPTSDKGDAAVLTIKGRIVYGGTGCTLVVREVFDELTKPYFRSDIVWTPRNMSDHIKFTAIKRPIPIGYGFHDVYFFMNLYKLGIPVHKIETTLAQRKLVELGKAGSNDGAHKITEWRKVKKDRYFTLCKNLPVQKRAGFVEVQTTEGIFSAHPDHAEKLFKSGQAQRVTRRPVVLDDSEII